MRAENATVKRRTTLFFTRVVLIIDSNQKGSIYNRIIVFLQLKNGGEKIQRFCCYLDRASQQMALPLIISLAHQQMLCIYRCLKPLKYIIFIYQSRDGISRPTNGWRPLQVSTTLKYIVCMMTLWYLNLSVTSECSQ